MTSRTLSTSKSLNNCGLQVLFFLLRKISVSSLRFLFILFSSLEELDDLYDALSFSDLKFIKWLKKKVIKINSL